MDQEDQPIVEEPVPPEALVWEHTLRGTVMMRRGGRSLRRRRVGGVIGITVGLLVGCGLGWFALYGPTPTVTTAVGSGAYRETPGRETMAEERLRERTSVSHESETVRYVVGAVAVVCLGVVTPLCILFLLAREEIEIGNGEYRRSFRLLGAPRFGRTFALEAITDVQAKKVRMSTRTRRRPPPGTVRATVEGTEQYMPMIHVVAGEEEDKFNSFVWLEENEAFATFLLALANGAPLGGSGSE
ncbi:MAG TPA: hypothetical protein QGH10_00625 [Armatimonadota bacterium]|nr:hypothetical protein [Armatimonadota bacterium]